MSVYGPSHKEKGTYILLQVPEFFGAPAEMKKSTGLYHSYSLNSIINFSISI